VRKPSRNTELLRPVRTYAKRLQHSFNWKNLTCGWRPRLLPTSSRHRSISSSREARGSESADSVQTHELSAIGILKAQWGCLPTRRESTDLSPAGEVAWPNRFSASAGPDRRPRMLAAPISAAVPLFVWSSAVWKPSGIFPAPFQQLHRTSMPHVNWRHSSIGLVARRAASKAWKPIVLLGNFADGRATHERSERRLQPKELTDGV